MIDTLTAIFKAQKEIEFEELKNRVIKLEENLIELLNLVNRLADVVKNR